MTRIPYLIAGLATLVAIAAPTSTGMASATKLKGTTGPGFTITLKKGTATAKTLQAGQVLDHRRRQVEDSQLSHQGPGPEQADHVPFVQGHEDGHGHPEEGQVHVPV